MAEEYSGRPWAEWQSRWDATPEAQRKIIFDYAQLAGTTDPKTVLALLADVHTGSKSFQSITNDTNDLIDEKFETYWNDFEIWGDQVAYDKQHWNKSRVKEVYKKQLMLRPDEPGQAIQNVERVVQNDTIRKQDIGFLDKRTGERVEGWEDKFTLDRDGKTWIPKPGTEAPIEDFRQTVIDTLKEAGIAEKDIDEATLNHFVEIAKDPEVDAYELKQMLQTDPDVLEATMAKQRAEIEPELQALYKDELALIDTEVDRMRVKSEKYFREEISPTIRREVGLLGGRGREFHSHALAKAAKEMEETRQDYAAGLRLGVETAEIERKRAWTMGKFEDMRSVSAYGGAQGLKQISKMYEEQLRNTEMLNKLSLGKANLLAERTQQRYNKALQQEQQRLDNEARARTVAASKKAAKLGMFANVFQGVVSGAISGGFPGAVAGGAAGYVSGYANMKGATGMPTPATASMYADVGYGAANLYDAWKTQNTEEETPTYYY
jgi:hypothetical protein